MIRAGNDAELITLGPGVRDHAFGLIAGCFHVLGVLLFLGGKRCAELLVVSSRALKDFDHRLQLEISLSRQSVPMRVADVCGIARPLRGRISS